MPLSDRIIPLMMVMVMMIMMLGAIFAIWGVSMQADVDDVEDVFHGQLESYYGGNSKADRDSAVAGSELTKQLAEIQKQPSELLRLKLVGVGRILTGIFIVLFGILGALMMMPFRVRRAMKQLRDGEF